MSLGSEVQAVRRSVGLLRLEERVVLRFVGDDRQTWLQGLLTTDVLTLPEGRGFQALMLNVQGHFLTEMRLFAFADAFLADLPTVTRDRILTTLDHYLIMEDVEVQDLSEEVALLSLQGPRSRELLIETLDDVPSLPPWGIVEASWRESVLAIARVTHTGEDGYDLLVPRSLQAVLWDALVAALPRHGGAVVGADTRNLLEIEAGIPTWGSELDESVVPAEAGLDHAISRTKGCYVGQEIIARLDARGRVNNLLVGLVTEGPLPGRGDSLIAAGRKVGRVTRAAYSPTLDRGVALGYLRREHAVPGTEVTVVGAVPGATTPEARLRVAELPFVPRAAPGS